MLPRPTASAPNEARRRALVPGTLFNWRISLVSKTHSMYAYSGSSQFGPTYQSSGSPAKTEEDGA